MSLTDALKNPERQRTGIDFVLRRAADLYPGRVAIDDRLRGRTVTYEQLRARSTQLARALARLGVGKGDLVAYAFFSEHASIEAMFACTMLGAIAVPLNGRLRNTEVWPYLQQHGCRLMLLNHELAHLANPELTPTLVLRGGPVDGLDGALDYEALLAAESDTPLPPVAHWDDPHMMAMTGGTTGSPKAAIWAHGGCLLDILSVALHMGVGRGCTTICLAPTYHAAGLGWGVMPVLWQGGRVIMPPTVSFNARFLQSELRATRIDYLLLVPALIEPLHDVWDGEPLQVGSLCVTSAPTAPAQRQKVSKMFPDAPIIAGYGMTETFSMTIQTPGEFLAQPLAVGEPSAVSRIRIVDDEGRRLPQGATGQIVARTLGMSLGYHDDEANTSKSFRCLPDDPEGLEWMMSGDIGRLDEEGRLTIVDRAKDIIITGGENVASVEVEAVIGEHPQVRECAAIGLPDERWGERLTVVAALRDMSLANEATARELVGLCRQRLAGYKVPKEIAFIEALPRSAFGKVLKRDLPQARFHSRFDGSSWRR